MLYMRDKFEQILEANQRHLLKQQNDHSAELQVPVPKAVYVKKTNKQTETKHHQTENTTCEIRVNVRQGNFIFMEYCSGVIELWK